MFTLAHLSDPHIGPLPEPTWPQLIGKRLTGYLNWRRKRQYVHDPAVLAAVVADMKAQKPDHIALTGDIVNIGLPEEFPPGRDFLESLGRPRNVTFVPGNHDIYVGEAAALATQHWQAYMTDDDGKGGFPFVRRRGPVALIGVNTGVPTAPFLATGWAGPKQLAALAAQLERLKKEKLIRVVLIHHPPESVAGRHKRLLDAALFKRVIAEEGAELILHGHDHIHMMCWLKGADGKRVPVIGVPSASAVPGRDKDAAAYHLFRIDGRPGELSRDWTCELISRGMNGDGAMVEEKRFMLGE